MENVVKGGFIKFYRRTSGAPMIFVKKIEK